VALNFIGIDPMKALYWAAVVNGMLAPPLMIVTMLIARNPKAMGDLVISKRLAFGGWVSTLVMVVIAVLFLTV
jgi:Mn2+/Fe2+ NRAMP family transporter